MDLDDAQRHLATASNVVTTVFQRLPGSSVIIRYVQSSYQNDPIRSAIELILVIFFVRYLLSPSYSTRKQNFVQLNEDVRPPSLGSSLGSLSDSCGRKSTTWWRSGFRNLSLLPSRHWRRRNVTSSR